MNIDLKKFLTLTAFMSQGLAASSGCIILTDGGDTDQSTTDNATDSDSETR